MRFLPIDFSRGQLKKMIGIMRFMNFYSKRVVIKVCNSVSISIKINFVIGVWSDLNLIGTRPKPLMEASMATIDEHRAFLLGIDIKEESYAFMLNVQIQVKLQSLLTSTKID